MGSKSIALTHGLCVLPQLDNMSDVDDLLDENAYKELCESEEH
ncbi:hypothetical protein OVW19_28275 [Klebsiella pneumoniae]|nr:hypothetical protein [Klebsiella pneumoniae]